MLVAGGRRPRPPRRRPFVPYFGKNNIHYDKFDWHIYTTDHFEIYYYPEIEKHLERVAGYAESAYQQISADLKHDLLVQGAADPLQDAQRVRAAERRSPARRRKASARSPSRCATACCCRSTIRPTSSTASSSHELTHHFEFDIIPQSLIRRNVPLWVERRAVGLRARPVDAARPDDGARRRGRRHRAEDDARSKATATPATRASSTTSATRSSSSSRRSTARKASASSCSRCARASSAAARTPTKKRFKMKKDEFDQAFERYLKDRFKPFRDKERPADYGRDLAPNQEKTHFAEALSIAPSPSGDLIAAVTVNRKDRRARHRPALVEGRLDRPQPDRGLRQGHGLRPHRPASASGSTMPWMSWSPKGDRLAYFVRTEKERTLIVQNVLTREDRAAHRR